MKYLFLCVCMSGYLALATNDPLVKAYERFARKVSGYEYVSNDLDPNASFLLSTSEITNVDYLEFLYQTRQTKGQEAYKHLLPDTTLWEVYPTFGETLKELYLRHPVYQDFPVVNISHDQAKAYCQWLSTILNQNEFREGYSVEVNLPTEAQWTYAATGADSENQLPWPGEFLENGDETRAYFNRISQFDLLRDDNDSLHIYESSYYYPHPTHMGTFLGDVHSLETGFWSLAHMGGNAAEFVAEKGTTKGGSWQDTAYYLMNKIAQSYEGNGASISNGFRVLVKLIPEEVN